MTSLPSFRLSQLSVFVFLWVVVSSLGLFRQLPVVLGLAVLVPSRLRVQRPGRSLWLGVGARIDDTQEGTDTVIKLWIKKSN